MRTVQAPSLLHNMRTHFDVPVRPLKANRLWAFDTPWPKPALTAGRQGMLHPILQALAPPGCSVRAPRFAIGCVAQISIDAIVGALAIGFAAACALTGQTQLAGAYLKEHGIHVVIVASAVIFSASAGLVGGFWLWALS